MGSSGGGGGSVPPINPATPFPGAALASNPAISTAGFPQPPPLTEGQLQVNRAPGGPPGMFGTMPGGNPMISTISGPNPNQLVPPTTSAAPAPAAPATPTLDTMGQTFFNLNNEIHPDSQMTIQQWLNAMGSSAPLFESGTGVFGSAAGPQQ
jgi:hypothetical protein